MKGGGVGQSCDRCRARLRPRGASQSPRRAPLASLRWAPPSQLRISAAKASVSLPWQRAAHSQARASRSQPAMTDAKRCAASREARGPWSKRTPACDRDLGPFARVAHSLVEGAFALVEGALAFEPEAPARPPRAHRFDEEALHIRRETQFHEPSRARFGPSRGRLLSSRHPLGRKSAPLAVSDERQARAV
jgi:hypothetical protein